MFLDFVKLFDGEVFCILLIHSFLKAIHVGEPILQWVVFKDP